jgi:hypothetical protein
MLQVGAAGNGWMDGWMDGYVMKTIWGSGGIAPPFLILIL